MLLENRDGLVFLQAEITAFPSGTKLQMHSTLQGRTCAIAPTTTLTPPGAADTGHTRDYWQFNTKGKLVRTEDTFHTIKTTPKEQTTEDQPSHSRMVQHARLMTSIKRWTTRTKQSNRCGKEKQFSGSRQGKTLLGQQLATKTQPKSTTEGFVIR